MTGQAFSRRGSEDGSWTAHVALIETPGRLIVEPIGLGSANVRRCRRQPCSGAKPYDRARGACEPSVDVGQDRPVGRYTLGVLL